MSSVFSTPNHYLCLSFLGDYADIDQFMYIFKESLSMCCRTANISIFGKKNISSIFSNESVHYITTPVHDTTNAIIFVFDKLESIKPENVPAEKQNTMICFYNDFQMRMRNHFNMNEQQFSRLFCIIIVSVSGKPMRPFIREIIVPDTPRTEGEECTREIENNPPSNRLFSVLSPITNPSPPINPRCPSANKDPNPCENKRDFLKQSLIFHPDKNPDCRESSKEKFIKLRNDESCSSFITTGGKKIKTKREKSKRKRATKKNKNKKKLKNKKHN